MTKESALEVDAEVIEILPAWVIKVILDEYGTEVRCKRSGKMKMNNVSLLPGDKVKVEANMYDPTQWRIVYRYNKSKS